MSASNEQLAMRFVELLTQSAARNGQSAFRWTTMNPAWRRVFIETVPAFLDEIGHQSIPVGHRMSAAKTSRFANCAKI
jgi:hypothetical protein